MREVVKIFFIFEPTVISSQGDKEKIAKMLLSTSNIMHNSQLNVYNIFKGIENG